MYSFEPAFPQLFKTPPGAHLDRGGDEELYVRLRADHGADVAPVEHRALGVPRRVPGEGALEFQHRGPDLRNRRHHRGRIGGLVAAQVRIL